MSEKIRKFFLIDEDGNIAGVTAAGLLKTDATFSGGDVTLLDGIGGINKAEVNANNELKVTGDVTLSPGNDPILVHDTQSPGSHPATLATHTVNTGKIFFLTGWGFSSEGAVMQVELQVAGVQKDSIIVNNSADTSRGTHSVTYQVPVIQVAAGVVVRLQTRSGGDTSKLVDTAIYGVEIDA